MRTCLYRAVDWLLPRVTWRWYCGYRLFYSRGTGIVDRIRFLSPQKIYERATCDAIVRELKQQPSKTFLDVGANIGLVSLYVKRQLPETRIYAFEPGVHQRALLDLTTHANQLNATLRVFPYALSDVEGMAEFYTNTDSRHVAGDGLIDTGRTPSTARPIPIMTKTIDRFVVEQALDEIGLIKIDVEGAELLALRGAEKTINRFRPVIFFELQPRNIARYPFEVADVFAYFDQLQYAVTDVSGASVTSANLVAALAQDDMFIAKPQT